MTRQHQTDIHTRQSCCSHGKQNRFGWQEIRRFHIHILPGLKQDADIALHDIRPRTDRTARNYLHETIVVDMRTDRWIILAIGNQRTVYEIPVYQKGSLNGVNSTALNTEMRIAPGLFLITLHIAQSYIHAADKAHFTIYDTEFAVVTIVYLTRKSRKADWHERMYINACITHTFKEFILHLPAAYIIINQSHLHSLLRLIDQGISYQISQGIGFEDIGIEMNMMLCLSYII